MNLEKLEEKNLARAAALVTDLTDQCGKLQKKIAANAEQNKKLYEALKETNQDLAEAKEYLDDLVKAKSDI